jgi:hypothetical protein
MGAELEDDSVRYREQRMYGRMRWLCSYRNALDIRRVLSICSSSQPRCRDSSEQRQEPHGEKVEEKE